MIDARVAVNADALRRRDGCDGGGSERLRWHTIRLCQLRQMVVDETGMKATIAEGGQLEQADEKRNVRSRAEDGVALSGRARRARAQRLASRRGQ